MASVDPITYWNEDGGRRWLTVAPRTAAIFRPLIDALLRFAAPRNGEKVLDVGCGTGTTLAALSNAVGREGRVVGLDVSRILLDVAREAIRAQRLTNAEVVLADAASYDFSNGEFELVFSQFGLMFFSDPLAAFRNLHRALAPSGRLAFSCWREVEANPCFTVPFEAAKPFAPPLEPPPPDAPGPLSLSDRARTERILTEGGFAAVECVRYDTSLPLGDAGELQTAAQHASNVGLAGRLLMHVDSATKARAVQAIAQALRPYITSEGIRMPASIWLVSARRGVTGAES